MCAAIIRATGAGMGETDVCYFCHEDRAVVRLPCPAGGTCVNTLCTECIPGWMRDGPVCMICVKARGCERCAAIRMVLAEFEANLQE